MWLDAAQNGVPNEDCAAVQKHELERFAAIWMRTLQLQGYEDLIASTFHEISR
jgi:hypothetical protein